MARNRYELKFAEYIFIQDLVDRGGKFGWFYESPPAVDSSLWRFEALELFRIHLPSFVELHQALGFQPHLRSVGNLRKAMNVTFEK